MGRVLVTFVFEALWTSTGLHDAVTLDGFLFPATGTPRLVGITLWPQTIWTLHGSSSRPAKVVSNVDFVATLHQTT